MLSKSTPLSLPNPCLFPRLPLFQLASNTIPTLLHPCFSPRLPLLFSLSTPGFLPDYSPSTPGVKPIHFRITSELSPIVLGNIQEMFLQHTSDR